MESDNSKYIDLPAPAEIDRREPIRSRLQIDLSKDTRLLLKNVARRRSYAGEKELVLRSLAQTCPDIADEILSEIRYTGDRYKTRK